VTVYAEVVSTADVELENLRVSGIPSKFVLLTTMNVVRSSAGNAGDTAKGTELMPQRKELWVGVPSRHRQEEVKCVLLQQRQAFGTLSARQRTTLRT
jgi:hypothetical protein